VNSRTLTGTILSGILLLATVGAAAAQTVVAPPPVVAPPVVAPSAAAHQMHSNENIGVAANRSGRLIAMLQRDERDYGGHRANAINDLNNAHNELTAAEQFAETHGYYTQNGESPEPLPEGPARHDQKRSNYSIGHVQEAVQRMIAHLQRDTRDFGGHRAAAINWLQQANGELNAAVQWEGAHPNG
jgi:hypothetical protein